MCLAQIGAPHGVRGEVHLKSFTAEPEAVAGYGSLQSEDGRRNFEIEALRPARSGLIARLRGVDDRSAAEALRGLYLYVSRAQLPATDDANTFYLADLIGLSIVDTQGASVGTVAGVRNFGAGDLLEVLPNDGGPTVLLPFTEAVVPEIDLTARKLVLHPPQGAFEAPTKRASTKGAPTAAS